VRLCTKKVALKTVIIELKIVLTSLTHPRKILLVVLQKGKAEDLSAPLRISSNGGMKHELERVRRNRSWPD
jgi:hypothetical protein